MWDQVVAGVLYVIAIWLALTVKWDQVVAGALYVIAIWLVLTVAVFYHTGVL